MNQLSDLDYYQHELGWSVRADRDAVLLSCAGTMTAIVLPSSWAGEVTHHLALFGELGPVIAVASAQPSWIVLAAAGDTGGRVATLPGVRVLCSGEQVPLPVTDGDSRGARWAVSPKAGGHRPAADAVLAAVALVPLPTRLAAVRMRRRAA